jgi:hypothetical protein
MLGLKEWDKVGTGGGGGLGVGKKVFVAIVSLHFIA